MIANQPALQATSGDVLIAAKKKVKKKKAKKANAKKEEASEKADDSAAKTEEAAAALTDEEKAAEEKAAADKAASEATTPENEVEAETVKPHKVQSKKITRKKALGTDKLKKKQAAPAGEDEGPGFFASHYPFGLNDNLEPEVEEDWVTLWVVEAMAGYLAGPLWVPTVMVGVDAGSDYKDEALWHWIWDLGLTAGSIPCAYSGFLCFGVGYLITLPLGVIHLIARSYYFGPVGVINLYDRHLKKLRGKIALENRFLDDKFLRETSVASTSAQSPLMAY